MDPYRNETLSVPDYLDREIFPILLSAMREMLIEVHRRDALQVEFTRFLFPVTLTRCPFQFEKNLPYILYRKGKCSFNALDCLAEILWNRNSLHPNRSHTWTDIFGIPQFQLWLRSQPIYPKSWLWTKEEAALRIQRYIRGWLVRKRADVQEMRQFWKIISAEGTELSIPESDKTDCRKSV
ncbi:PREDICTED: IQ domain-containing protein K-like isoform X2 [Dinoponera quadriceps]|uniref:IQ domain-containing protein K-like isoform X2 n=1 Tax=Dinoponera quadriceps TaxID=609295 RepID=A0A6P3XGH9_DINQU|nr:PREDICTED: IQ domain-containing protein K-like isoform X2 [Dinoponera quadriceps]